MEATNTLSFEITCAPTLVRDESAPFATAYLTSDIACTPRMVQSDFHGARLWKTTQQQQQQPSANVVKFTVSFKLVADAQSLFAADSALCVQTYCELRNNKDEPCCHRCGFATFCLLGMKNEHQTSGATAFSVRMRDHGPGFDRRGTAQVRFLGDTGNVLIRRVDWSPPHVGDLFGDPNEGDGARAALSISTEYFAKTDQLFATMQPNVEGIRVKRLPIYTLSGGMIMPSIAFLLFVQLPYACEDFYVSAISAALYRDMPWSGTDADRIRRFCAVPGSESGALSWDEKGSILMSAAMLFPTMFPYLYDYGISKDGTDLVAVDEFARTFIITYSGDCEDDSNFAAVFLADILTGSSAPGHKWTTEIVRVAQLVRAQYVVTIVLKAVTRPSASGDDMTTSAHRSSFAAHACCDMISVRAFLRMLKLSGHRPGDAKAVEATALERAQLLVPENEQLLTVIGEGTGCVASLTRPEQIVQSWAKQETRRIVAPIFKSSRLVSREEMAKSSAFYKHVLSALVHDTLLSPGALAVARTMGSEWCVPQVVYATTHSGERPRYSATHENYYAGAQNVVALPVEPPSAAVLLTISRLKKYEHPVPAITRVPKTLDEVSPAHAATFRELKGALDQLSKSRAVRSGGFAVCDATVCTMMHELTGEKMRELLDALSNSEMLIGVTADARVLAEYAATLILHLRFAAPIPSDESALYQTRR